MRTKKYKLFYLAITLFIIEIYTHILDIRTRSGLLIVSTTRTLTQTKSDYVSVTRLLYIHGVVETKQFGGPNSHVDTHSDVGAVTQMDLSKK